MTIQFFAILLLACIGCGSEHHMSLMEKIERAAPAAAAPATDSGVRLFSVLSRHDKLAHFPCRGCHTDGFNLSAAAKRPQERRSHWDVELRHAPADVMTCATCHDYRDLNHLNKNNGEAVSFDEPSAVCRSCHFQQFKDWSGGAHGKQFKSWTPPRVRYNCTPCHNPHRPAFQKRWPVTYPSVPRRYP